MQELLCLVGKTSKKDEFGCTREQRVSGAEKPDQLLSPPPLPRSFPSNLVDIMI